MIAITDDTFDGPKMSENRALLTLRTGTRPSILWRQARRVEAVAALSSIGIQPRHEQTETCC
jgi:hypothetical protein